ncbi:MAG: alanyl-tRNA editing protein [Pseudomonadales bacterium]|jgi:misacylated tRNA(Ala) deacylase|nr:alanyl-tRNA editing protein [Pseudomonadales bacterium]
MTERLYEQDAYLKEADARVVAVSEAGVVLDRTIFYARGGGQPGDSGELLLPSGVALRVVDTVKGEGAEILHQLEPGAALPEVGETVTARIDWDRRHRHMRMHTCLHLLCAVVDAPVTGGNLNDEKGRLDFDLPESTVDKATLTDALNELIERAIDTKIESITDEELAANPSLVKTMSVQPPTGAGTVRLLRIGDVDLQPCGGTHVANIGEIGRVRVSKIEKKSRLNRRINVVFDEA